MLEVAIQRLESRFEQLVEDCQRLKDENASLVLERDALLRDRQFMCDEIDRILLRFEKRPEDTP